MLNQSKTVFNGIKKLSIPLINQFVEANFEVIMASVCTEDGFVIHHRNSEKCDLEGDKMAAITSTLISIAEASVQSIASGKLRVTIVESDSANLFVIRTLVHETAIVLGVAVSRKISIGQSLFITNRLSNALESL